MKESQRSTAFNIISTLITKFVLLFGGFIISVILARLLGAEGQGIITAVFVFPLLIVSLADMGIRQSTAYFIGHNKYNLTDIISSVSFLWLLTSFLSIISVFFYFYFGLSDKYSWVILMIALTSVPVMLIENYGKGILQGRNQISAINLAQILRLISNFVAVIILVWIFDLGILGAAIVQVIFSLSVAIYYLMKIKTYGKISFKPIKPIPKGLLLRGFSFAIVLFVINLNYKVDIMMLDFMVSSSDVGIYSVGTKTAELMWQIPSAVGMVLFSKSAVTKNQISSIKRSTTILRMIMPVIIIVSIMIAILAPLIIHLFFGTEFKEAGNLLRILLPGVCLITISKILHPDLAARGYPLYALKVFVTTLILNIILNFIFIPAYGVYGAALTSTISYSIAGIWYGFVYARKEGLNIKDVLLINRNDIYMLINLMKSKIKR